MKITADFSRRVRKIGRMNGMNNGPRNVFTDRTEEFSEMGVDLVRFHDDWVGAYGVVDMPWIFPDETADPADPDAYHFEATDGVLRAALDAGCEIIYRLGASAEGFPQIYTAIPRDPEKWAQVAIHIMMHYNDGWKNGFHWEIRNWEIWNEPDLPGFWPGKRADYIRFYETVAPILKAYDPKNKIGGPASANCLVKEPAPNAPEKVWADYRDRYPFVGDFLRTCVEKNLPLDFFSFHGYVGDTITGKRKLDRTVELMKEAGIYGKIPAYYTEWGPMRLAVDKKGVWDFTQMEVPKSAAVSLGFMILMQKCGVDAACYYHADEATKFCGLYDFDGSKKLHYYVMRAWKDAREAEWEVESSGDSAEVHHLSASNGKKSVSLFSNESGSAVSVTFSLKGLENPSYTLSLLDGDHAMVPLRRGKAEEVIRFRLPAHSCVEILFE